MKLPETFGRRWPIARDVGGVSDSGRRVVAIGLVLLLHLCAIRFLTPDGPVSRKHELQSLTSVTIEGSASHMGTVEELPLQLTNPNVPILTPPTIDIAASKDAGNAHFDAYALQADLPPRPDPELPNVPPEIPSTLQGVAGAGHSVVVIIRALVLESGTIGNVLVAGSCGASELDALALEQVRKHWHFLPAMSSGKVVRDWISVEVLLKAG